MSEVMQKKSPYSAFAEMWRSFKNVVHHARLLLQHHGCTNAMATVGGANYLVKEPPKGGRLQWKLRGFDEMVHSSRIAKVYEPSCAKR